MEVSNWITILSWPITFLIGILSGWILHKIKKKKKVIIWSVITESNILSVDSLNGFGVPIEVSIDGQNENNFSTIRIRLANKGNIEIEKISIQFDFGEDAKIYVGQFLDDLGVYREKVSLSHNNNVVELEADYINEGQVFDLEFLVGNYKMGSVNVDLAEPGVNLKHVDNTMYDIQKDLLSILITSLLSNQVYSLLMNRHKNKYFK